MTARAIEREWAIHGHGNQFTPRFTLGWPPERRVLVLNPAVRSPLSRTAALGGSGRPLPSAGPATHAPKATFASAALIRCPWWIALQCNDGIAVHRCHRVGYDAFSIRRRQKPGWAARPGQAFGPFRPRSEKCQRSRRKSAGAKPPSRFPLWPRFPFLGT